MSRSLSRIITHEPGLKLLSLLVAVGLWFYVMNTQDPMRGETLERLIEPVNVPADLEVVRILPESIAVNLRGRVSGLDRRQLSAVRVVADLSHGEPGRNEAPLSVRSVPDRVRLESLQRSTARVELEPRSADKAKVVPIITGTPPEGYEVLGDIVVQPSQVALSGTEGIIKQVSQVVVRLDVEGLAAPQSLARPLQALDARQRPVEGITLDPPTVLVQVPIHRVQHKQVPVRARMGAPPAGHAIADIRVSPDTVTVKGRPEIVRDIREVVTEWQSIRSSDANQEYRLPLVIPAGAWPVDDLRTVLVRVNLRPVSLPARPRADEPDEVPAPAPEREPAPEPDEAPPAEAPETREAPQGAQPETPRRTGDNEPRPRGGQTAAPGAAGDGR